MNKFVGALFVGIALAPSMSRAATIAWGSAVNVAGDTDVSTNGILFQAANVVHASGVTTTVNGTTFERFEVVGGPVHTLGNFTLTSVTGTQGYPSYGSGSSPFFALSGSYQAMLGQGGFGPSAITLEISGLTIGEKYEVQMWANDSQNVVGNPQTLTAGNAVVLDPNTSDAAGGTGQYVIGTFNADATTQQIVISSTGTVQTNGFQVRVVPEPSGFILLGLSACGISLRRRRR